MKLNSLPKIKLNFFILKINNMVGDLLTSWGWMEVTYLETQKQFPDGNWIQRAGMKQQASLVLRLCETMFK